MEQLRTDRHGSTLYIVVPCYNEEEGALGPPRPRRECALHGQGLISEESRVMLVNDGSSDRTWELICKLHEADRLFCGVCLSRNRGHQNTRCSPVS